MVFAVRADNLVRQRFESCHFAFGEDVMFIEDVGNQVRERSVPEIARFALRFGLIKQSHYVVDIHAG